jgi:hypothetical protein
VGVSGIPYLEDVLPEDVVVIALKEAAQRMGVPITRIEQMVRDRELIAFKRKRVPVVPEVFVGGEGGVLKGLPATITLLRDGGYTEEEIVRWLFTDDDTLPGSPIAALHGNRGKEVTRRAQAMAM